MLAFFASSERLMLAPLEEEGARWEAPPCYGSSSTRIDRTALIVCFQLLRRRLHCFCRSHLLVLKAPCEEELAFGSRPKTLQVSIHRSLIAVPRSHRCSEEAERRRAGQRPSQRSVGGSHCGNRYENCHAGLCPAASVRLQLVCNTPSLEA